MADLPARIEVGPYTYRVTEAPEEYHAEVVRNSDDFWARINFKSGSIFLDADQPPDHKRMAVLHEVIHAVWHCHTCKGREYNEETVVEFLAPGLLDTLRRNPELVAFLLGTDDAAA